jgi:hypothetical protein
MKEKKMMNSNRQLFLIGDALINFPPPLLLGSEEGRREVLTALRKRYYC